MALSKTFTSGQPLSAADVNAHLAHQVPNAGDPLDTSWTTLTATPGTTVTAPIQVRRIGMQVFFRGEVSGAWNTAGTTIVAAGGVPAWARPGSYRDSGSALGSSGAVAAVGTVGSDGQLVVRALAAASGGVYLKGLSGYTVN